jgi:adenylate cyclase
MPKVKFIPLNKEREIKSHATLLAAANQVEVPLGQSCSGEGICGWCRVRVVDGVENLAPPTPLEKRLMDHYGFKDDERAACLAKVKGDVTITTTYW